MAIFNVKIVMRTINVGWNNSCEQRAILFIVTTVDEINHPLGMAVAKVAFMRGSIMNLKCIDTIIRSLIWVFK